MTALAATATSDLWSAWSLDPLALIGAAVAVGFFLSGWRRLHRRRPEAAPWTRIPLFLAGIAIVLVALVSPVDAIAEEYLQSAHMLQHVLLADLGVALTIVALRGPLSLFFLPRDLLAPLARTIWLRRALSFLLRPWVAVSLWLAALVAWHVPALYDAALENQLVHRLEHVSLVVVGLLVWSVIIDPTGHGRLSLAGRIGVAVVVLWAGQLLAYVFVFGFEPYYDVYVDAPERLFGLSPLTDQKLAGVVMMVEQALTLGVAIVVLVLAARRGRQPQRASAKPAEI